MRELRQKLARLKQRSAKARDAVARQRELILRLEEEQRHTSVAEDFLHAMTETLRVYEDAESCFIDELKLVAPEEWRLNYAEKLEAPPANKGNKLLSSLPFTDLTLMQPFLERVGLNSRSRLQITNRILKTVHFLESGMVSVVAVTGGGRSRTQVGLIGREGMTGIPIVFGSMRSPFDLEVEVEGQGQCIATKKLLELMEQSPSIRTALVDYVQTLWLQFAQTAAANAHGTIEQRLARLLLVVEERLESDEIKLTHEQLATMLAVRRAGVTVALQRLEACGLINRERGNVTIADHVGLQAATQRWRGDPNPRPQPSLRSMASRGGSGCRK
jgi:CRP-like cAMP-binding protein